MAEPPTIDEFARRGGEDFERKFNRWRVVLMFCLGCVLIVYSVIHPDTNLGYIIVGAVLIGLVPVDQWLQRLPGKGDNNDGDPQN